ncbi:hypothetical protein HN51_067776 [Arachis hypogaea]|uniref:biorientation of chromosomes in cell division protein 1-like 1 n=1 Tax=Arachis ipaensis TaxID=130454 RepID=UPI0007AFC705|nr:biorientation of chromosomes in cell division protein 1-like 1 [Arachis ipaensis]XP_020977713.1 biorientation of chromosomes in cell division protein 1-like 1 [Arachis ipaensis]XP_025649981.1 biorientation of chromosomes in cell division protein 1-like 1 [Arachis hypogaea]XP_029148198.1 biorientation of chromosomes in cell division protein 1-like 1 [Arachis hypogaea]QHO09226.1 uncharacterized protein DS421_14g479440 [Arachis hypogaea]
MAPSNIDIAMITEIPMSGRGEFRRHSTGKLSAGIGEQKALPHYLRSSTGSCHDHCKFGKNEETEAKKRPSIPKSGERKIIRRNSEEVIGGVTIFVDKRRASLDSKAMQKISVFKNTESVKSMVQNSHTSDSQKQIGNEVPMNRNRTSLAKKMREGTSSREISKKEETPLISTAKIIGTSSKKPSSKDIELSDKHVIFVNANAEATRKTVSKNSSMDFGGSKSREIKIEKKREVISAVASPSRVSLPSLKASLKRIPSINARKHKSLKIASNLKNQTKPRKENPEPQHNEVEEKTLYILEVENESQTLQSDHQNESPDTESSLSNSPLTQSSSEERGIETEKATTEFGEDTSSGSNGIACMENVNNNNTLEAEENDKPRKDEISCSKEEEGQVLRKVEIFSRQMVETQTEKRHNPRKLKFKRGSMLWNNAKGEATQGVVLRNNLKGKKYGEALMNNVIEETANKLVEIQRSKVKALVGAFESIISQQNSKSPLENTLAQ